MPTSIAIALAAGAAQGGVLAATGSALLGWIAAGATSFLLRAATTKKPNQSLQSERSSQLISIRQAAAPRRVIYGEERVGGIITYMEAESADNAPNAYVHYVVTLAGHVCREITQVYLDDKLLSLDGSYGVRGGFSNGMIFDGHVMVVKSLGDEAGQPFPQLVEASADLWTDLHRQTGCTKLHVRLLYNQQVFPNGTPNITAVVKGKAVLDPRQSPPVERWTPNNQLCVADYLTDSTIGLGTDRSTELNEAQVIDGANICDERVALSGIGSPSNVFPFLFFDLSTRFPTAGLASPTIVLIDADGNNVTSSNLPDLMTGTGVTLAGASLPAPLVAGTEYFIIRPQFHDRPCTYQLADTYDNAVDGIPLALTFEGSGDFSFTVTSERRYTLNGTFTLDEMPETVIAKMMTSMGGRPAYISGEWWVYPASYRTPTMDPITEADIRGPVHIQPRLSKSDLCNRVKGTYAGPASFWQADDFPPVVNATYLLEDNDEQIWRNLDLPFTKTASMAQRLAKIELERTRQQITLELPCKLRVWECQPGDVVPVSLSRYGYSSKAFEVVESSLVHELQGDAQILGVDLLLRETASTVYDWNSGEETVLDPAPDTNLPDAFTIMTQVPPRVSGLELVASTNATAIGSIGSALLALADGVLSLVQALVDETTGAYLFSGKDAKFRWRKGSNTGAAEMGSEIYGADSGLMDDYFLDFQVVIRDWDADGGATRRIEFVVDPEYTYTYEKNIEDGGGTVNRRFEIRVKQRTKFGQKSALPAILNVSNASPTLVNLDTAAVQGGFQVFFDNPDDTDFLGARVYASTEESFTPGTSNLVLDTGLNPSVKTAGLIGVEFPGMTYHVKVIPYDAYGAGSTYDAPDVTPLPISLQQPIGNDAAGHLMLISSRGVADIFSVLPMQATGNEHPILVPLTQQIAIIGKKQSESLYYAAAIDPVTLQTAKVCGFGSSSVDDLIYSPFAEQLYAIDRANATIYPMAPAAFTNGVIASVAMPTSARSGRVFCPSDNKILFADRKTTYGSGDQSVMALATYHPTSGWSSEVQVNVGGSPSNNVIVRDAVYAAGADRYAILTMSDAGAIVSFVSRDLGTVNSYVATGSITNAYGVLYSPIDDRVWITLELSTGAGRIDVIKPDFTLDYSITLGVGSVPRQLSFIGWLSLILGFGACSGGSGFFTFSPLSNTAIAGPMLAGRVAAVSTNLFKMAKVPANHSIVACGRLDGASTVSALRFGI